MLRQKNNTIILILFLYLICATNNAKAQKYNIEKFDIKLSGSSNLHDWSAEVTKANGHLIVVNDEIKTVHVTILTKSIISSGGSLMDQKLHSALNANQYPHISYNSLSTDIISRKNNILRVKSKANLKINGVTKKINHTVIYERKSDKKLKIRGKLNLLMSDFDVTPPTAMFGTLRTNDRVMIEFTVYFEKK